MAKCNGFGAPFIVYVILTIIGLIAIIFTNNAYINILMPTPSQKIKYILGHLLINAFWAAIIYWLCSTCHQYWAWAIVLFPIIIGILVFVIGFGAVAYEVESKPQHR